MTNHGRQQRRLAPIDFAELKATVPITALLELMHWEPARTQQGGSELRGPCPVHGSTSETSTTFSVNTEKNNWHCFKCDEGGNTLDLAAHHFNIPREQSVRVAVELCKELGIEIPRKA